MKRFIVPIALCILCIAPLHAKQYWRISKDGNSITWQLKKGETHHDHIEMSGKSVSVVLRYGVNAEGEFELNKSMVWPMLRTVPNNTHGSLMRRLDWNPLDAVTANGRALQEQVKCITLNGTLEAVSDLQLGGKSKMTLKRTFFPSAEHPALVEMYEFANVGETSVTLELPHEHTVLHTDPEKGVKGSYAICMDTDKGGSVTLAPGQSFVYSATLAAYAEGEEKAAMSASAELARRKALVDEWTGNLMLETPDPVINEMFAFSKIRALESIYETKGGPMHGPGGESYYAAIWANDQAEYINPYFPYTGYAYGNASALNSFRLFARYMNPDWKPIPSLIVAEGDSYWNGAGDRGDAAMIAYGAARYALARGSREEASRLWPLIEWCLEFCRRKINPEGVVASDSDELEGRFPAGNANLCTSSLYYDALLSAAYLADDLGKGKGVAKRYRDQARQLRKSIDTYFAAEVEGYDTYAYYKGNDVLRAWICIPLTVGIHERAEGTVDALFSPRLWTENGLLTQAGSETFWDRSTLYALRGVFMAGEREKALKFLKHYSSVRLLGEHVPYAVEAWPEGGQRHLSAESALYGRIFTEGMFGICPTGLNAFSLQPQLPAEWDRMALRKVKAFNGSFDIEVVRLKEEQLRVTVWNEGKQLLKKKIKNGTALNCIL